MKKIVLIAFVFVSFAANAQFVSWCQLSYRFDSYGQGIASVIKGSSVNASWTDEGCFHLGQKEAKETMEREGEHRCKSDFKDGYEKGFEASPSSAGVPCFRLGYVAGVSTLGAGARDANDTVSTPRCVKAYKLGKLAAAERKPSNPETTEQPEYYCYQLGFQDGQFFP